MKNSQQSNIPKKRVLILDPAGSLWGSERVLLDFLSAASSDAQWSIALCCPPESLMIERVAGYNLRIFPTFARNLHLKRKPHRLLAAARLAMTVAKFRPDLLYLNQAGATKIALFATRWFRIPVVVHVRLVEDVAYLVRLWRSPQIKRIVCVSHFIRNLFDPHSDIPRDRLITVHDTYRSSFEPSSHGPTYNDRMVKNILCLGRLADTKGQNLLLDALPILMAKRPDVRLLIVGDAAHGDREGQKLRERIQKERSERPIEWVGFQNNVWPWIERATILVCPSLSESLGRVIFEAWDGGALPVAWKGSGGVAEVIAASGGGVLYEEQTAQSLAIGIEKALSLQANDRVAMIQRGRKWMEEHCDPVKYAKVLTQVWQDALV